MPLRAEDAKGCREAMAHGRPANCLKVQGLGADRRTHSEIRLSYVAHRGETIDRAP
jgi:hypothetical protein